MPRVYNQLEFISHFVFCSIHLCRLYMYCQYNCCHSCTVGCNAICKPIAYAICSLLLHSLSVIQFMSFGYYKQPNRSRCWSRADTSEHDEKVNNAIKERATELQKTAEVEDLEGEESTFCWMFDGSCANGNGWGYDSSLNSKMWRQWRWIRIQLKKKDHWQGYQCRYVTEVSWFTLLSVAGWHWKK